MVEAYFASARLDAVFLPISFRLKGEELAKVLEAASPSVVLAGIRYIDMVEDLRERRAGPAEPGLRGRRRSGWAGWDTSMLLEGASPRGASLSRRR